MAAPTSRKSTAAPDDTEVTVPLQAVLVVDSFEARFRPVSLERPTALFPLMNTALIDYTLEWLQSAGVEEVFVVICCSHVKQVLSHIEESGTTRGKDSNFGGKGQRSKNSGGGGGGGCGGGGRNSFTVKPIIAQNCATLGDALRIVDGKGVIRGDFILVRGDTVANFSVADALEEHRSRRKKDKRAVMTMLLRRCKSSDKTRQTRFGSDQLLVAFDSVSNQLLLYDDGSKWVSTPALPPPPDQRRRNQGREAGTSDSDEARKSRYARLDSGALKRRASVQFRTDLVDCFIDICAPEVLSLFTDNFDYQTLRKDFVKGVLSDEVMGNEVHVHVLPEDSYGARVDSWRAYDAVGKDVIRGWAHPFAPLFHDTWHAPKVRANDTFATHEEHGSRCRHFVSVAVSAVIGPDVVIGDGCSIGEGSVIRNSVLGPGCQIRSNVTISGSYLWQGVTVGDHVRVLQAVLCDNVVVLDKATIEPGVVLSSCVVIGAGHSVSRYCRVSLKPPREEKEEEEEEEEEEEDDEEKFSSLTARTPTTGISISGGGGGGPQKETVRDDATCVSNDGAKEEEEEEGAWKVEEVGVGGKGFIWRANKQESDTWRFSIGPIPREKLEDMAMAARAETELERREDDDYNKGFPANSACDSSRKNGGEDEEEEEEEDQEDDDEDGEREFEREVIETVKRIVAEGVKMEDANVEIMGLKLAYNKDFVDCASGVLKAILDTALSTPFSKSTELLGSLKKTVKKLSPLLKKFLKNANDEVELLLALEEVCTEGPPETRGRRSFAPIFVNVLEVLYDAGLIREDSILSWEEYKKGSAEADRVFVKQCETFVKWLREAAEETDEDDEEEEDE